jgi:hypothetical protein
MFERNVESLARLISEVPVLHKANLTKLQKVAALSNKHNIECENNNLKKEWRNRETCSD